MSVVRVGTSSKYASGWDAVFGGAKPRASGRKAGSATAPKKAGGRASAVKKGAKAVAKKTPKPKAAKKASKRR